MFLHIDGDAFFASCEVALNPRLRGKPVVTGLEKGIASSMSYEAKRRGVTRAMPLFEIKKVCPEAIIINSSFDTYTTFSRRMFSIIRSYTDKVEEYSIDECFADITHYGENEAALLTLGRKIKEEIRQKLAITVSLGIAPTKVLAKVASKWQKPDGLTFISADSIQTFLEKLPIGKVWGIGPSTSVRLNKLKIFTALDFIQKSETWVEEHLAKPYVETWHELRGVSMYTSEGAREKHKSIMKTRMFKPPSKDPAYIFSELSKNIENACSKARRLGLSPQALSLYLKTQTFSYHTCEVACGKPIRAAHELVRIARDSFSRMYKQNTLYRATGVILRNLVPTTFHQADLFGASALDLDLGELYKNIDTIDRRFGRHTVFLASSLRALGEGKEKIGKRPLPLPSMGEVW